MQPGREPLHAAPARDSCVLRTGQSHRNAPVAFDTTAFGRFDLDSPPSPWIDLGWVDDFSRKCASKVGVLAQGAPASAAMQLRETSDATVGLRFLHWGKLQMALAGGSEHWNLLNGGTACAITAGSPNEVGDECGGRREIFARTNCGGGYRLRRTDGIRGERMHGLTRGEGRLDSRRC